MTNTIKFSQFAAASLSNATNTLVGTTSSTGGTNIQRSAILMWTTSTRPSSPATGVLGYNSSLSQYEYWTGSSWVQLAAGGSGSVNSGTINQLGYYASSGTAISGLTSADNSLLSTNGSGVPAWSTTIPSGITIPQPLIGGITSGVAASAGYVGQIISSTITQASGTVLPAYGSAENVTSITLSAGQWLIFGNCGAYATAVIQILGWINSISASIPDYSSVTEINIPSGTYNNTLTVPTQPVNISSPTTYYLSIYVNGSGGSPTMWGNIFAIRIR